jgi:hypothetical protein
MGGEVNMESTPEKGSTLAFSLPRARPSILPIEGRFALTQTLVGQQSI